MDAANVEAEWLIACVRPWYAPLQALGSLEPLDDASPIAWIRVAHAQSESSSVRFLEGTTLLALLAHADHAIYRRVVKEIAAAALLVLVETLPLLLSAGGVEFQVVQLNNLMASSPALAMEGLECVVKLIQLGISIDALAELHADCASPANAVKLLEALRTIAAVPLSPEGSGGQVKALVASDESPVPVLAAVVSSLHQNQTAESLYLRMTVEPPRPPALTREDIMALMSNDRDPNRFRASNEDRFLWRLIARSLFSVHAEHRLQTLYLTVSFLGAGPGEHVTTLWQEEAAASSYCLIPSTYLTAARFHLEDPTKPKPKKKQRRNRPLKSKPIYESDSPVQVRVLDHAFQRNSSEWWCCGLPGWGEAWVASADVISLTEEAERKPTHWSGRHGIPEISIELMSDDSSHCVSTLVVSIGHKTRKLVVKQYQGSEPLDSWCRQVLQQTPMLEELRLYDGSFNSLQVFVDSAASGYSHLKSLSIRNVWTFSFDKICCLFQTLGDCDHDSMDELKTTLETAFASTSIEKIPIWRRWTPQSLARSSTSLPPTVTRDVSVQFNVIPAVVNEWDDEGRDDDDDEWDHEGGDDDGGFDPEGYGWN